MTIQLTKEERAMVLATTYGLNGDQAEQFVADVTAELEAIEVPITKNHIRAAATKVLARGK
jgi:hypothetical protein